MSSATPSRFRIPRRCRYAARRAGDRQACEQYVPQDDIERVGPEVSSTQSTAGQPRTSQISGEALLTIAVPNSGLALVNPAENLPALTITSLAGGARPDAASLIIKQLD